MVAQVASVVTIRMVDAASIKSPSKCSVPNSPNSPPPQRQNFAARELDPFLRNLSPAATLEALKASNAVDSSAGSKHRLLTNSISNVSPSERALGIRAAVAAKKSREWHSQIRSWSWPSGQFEPPPLLDQQSRRRKSHNGSIDGVFADERFVDDRYDMTYWGSLPAETVQQYERRLEEMQDGLDALEIEDLKTYIRKAHLPNGPGTQTLPLASSHEEMASSAYNRLDDFTVVITATIMQTLPFLSRLTTLMELWQTRLLVLRQVPVFLHQLEDAQTAVASAKASVSKGVETDLTRDAYHTMKEILASRTAALAQTLDGMLDILEDRPDTLPDHWIDDMEDVEKQCQNWVVGAEQVVMANELEELRSIAVDPSDAKRADSSLGSESYRSKANSAQELGSQSDATAVDEENSLEYSTAAFKAAHRQPPSAIKVLKQSDWAETDAIKMHAAKNLVRRPSLTYSDLSEGPEVIQTAHIHYVCLSPTVASHPTKPSLIEISSGSSKRSSHHSTRSDGATSTSLTRSGSTSTDESRNYHHDEPTAVESGVSGPPAVLAPWPPRNVSNMRLAQSLTRPINVQESWLYDSDSEDEGGLRSYGSLSPMVKSTQASIKTTSHNRNRSLADSAPTGPSISVDDFFDAVVQPFSELSVPESSTITRHYSMRSSVGMIPEIPSRTTSKHAKSKPRKQKSTRAVSPSSNSHILETQLNLRISNLLSEIPAPILFSTSPERDRPATASTVVHDSSALDSSVLTGPHTFTNEQCVRQSVSKPASDPARPRSGFISRSTQSDVRLYYLHHPSRVQPTKLYVRLVGETGERVMVRVGGGWSDLGEYLNEYAAHHGRYARAGAVGTELELKDLPFPSSASPLNTSRVDTKAPTKCRRTDGYVFARQAAGMGNGPKTCPLLPASKIARHASASAVLTGRIQSADGISSQIMPRPRQTVTPPPPLNYVPTGLGPAGPLIKQKDISPRKRAWVEGVMRQARKASRTTPGVSITVDREDWPPVSGTIPATPTREIISKK